MPSIATSLDVEARWRPLSAQEAFVADTLLSDAWVLLLQHLPDIEDRITADTLDAATVTMVQARMVIRVLKNPEGYRQASIDDWSYTRDQVLSSGELYASAEDLALLDGAGASSEAFTISPYGEPGYTTTESWT